MRNRPLEEQLEWIVNREERVPREGFLCDLGCRVYLGYTKYYPRLFSIWKNMLMRCYNVNDSSYSNYGSRGIIVDSSWFSLKQFQIWSLNNGYSELSNRSSCTLDRIDNNVGYTSFNCRWVVWDVQCRNKRRSYKVDDSHLKDLWESSSKVVSYNTFYERVVWYNWDINKALTMESFRSSKISKSLYFELSKDMDDPVSYNTWYRRVKYYGYSLDSSSCVK